MKPLQTLAWELPNSLKRAQLVQIATKTGAPLAGTKQQLQTGIYELVKTTQQDLSSRHGKTHRDSPHGELRVLSIDMGIRNLAFAFLTSRLSTGEKSSTQLTFNKPILQKWRRAALADATMASNASPETKPVSDQVSVPEESFEPNVLTQHAYTFAKYCASLQPTHILIERQRFRSGGQSAVQEWSLRVGMLEGMLYATFHTLTREKLLLNTTVEPMLPMRVNKFWFADQDTPATGKQAKAAKIAMVNQMLADVGTKSAAFEVHEVVRDVVESFGIKLGRGARTEKVAKGLSKLDDMSDALLQGLAWLAWQQNRVRLLQGEEIGVGKKDNQNIEPEHEKVARTQVERHGSKQAVSPDRQTR